MSTGGACFIQTGPSTLILTLIWVPPMETERAQLAFGWGMGSVKLTCSVPLVGRGWGSSILGWRSRQGETWAGQVVSQEQEMKNICCVK